MGSITKVPSGESGVESGARRFRGRSGRPKMDADLLTRQAQVALLAFQAFPDREASLAFLNEHCDAVDGRPLDVAGASDEGLAAVSAVLKAREAS